MPTHRLWQRLIILASGLFLGGLVLGSLLMPTTAFTQATTQGGMTRPLILPVVSCASLGSVDLSRLDTVIVSAADVTAGGHAYCDVKGYISPQTRSEVLLPEKTWRGDYLQEGCGGLCGQVNVSLTGSLGGYQAPFAPATNGELGLATDDQGHESPSNRDGLWGENDPQLRG